MQNIFIVTQYIPELVWHTKKANKKQVLSANLKMYIREKPWYHKHKFTIQSSAVFTQEVSAP